MRLGEKLRGLENMLECLRAEDDIYRFEADGPRVAFEVHRVRELVPEVALRVRRVDAHVSSGRPEERSRRLRAATDVDDEAIDRGEFAGETREMLPAWRSINRRSAANQRRTRVSGGE